MFKKLTAIVACAVLALTGMCFSATSFAQSASYYFVSVCTVPNPIDCAGGPNPFWFGPYPTVEACIAGHDAFQNGFFGTWPRTLSTCFPS